MKKLHQSFWLGPLLSGVLTFISICEFNLLTAWICYIPLFICIRNKTRAETFKAGFFFGVVFSILAFAWMIPGAERFTGHSVFYGFGVFLISAIFYSIFCAALLSFFALTRKTETGIRGALLNAGVVAAIFCIGEALLRVVSSGLPWFDFHSGNALTGSLYGIQPGEYFGVHIMTFTVVLVNYLLAVILVNRSFGKIYIPLGIVAVYFIAGYFIFSSFETRPPGKEAFNVAILAENIPPGIKWDDNTGEMLVKRLLDLNRLAATEKPDIALWSESAIPWTYSKDDDLVREVLKITDPANITHVMGINTAYKENEVFNSAYHILPGGKVSGRYDKQHLLSFIEKPFSGLHIPFFSSRGFFARVDSQNSNPVTTAFGKAGFMICNEAALPLAAATQVKRGAEFLFILSNDGWFSDTYIVKAHYNYARLRAVESRKDIAINCNNGYSGLIKASGEISEQVISEDPYVKTVSMQPHNNVTLATRAPDLFVYVCAVYLVAFIISSITATKKRRSHSTANLPTAKKLI
jgi:apolipoprotein N-acyltransferase